MSVIPKIDEPDSEELRELYERLSANPMGNLNIFRIMAYNPKLLRNWLRMATPLLTGGLSLEPRLREIAILRVAQNVVAVQAVYSNLLGLTLLVVLSPVLIVLGVVARGAAGAGSFFDEAECAGFQNIPFARLRFRTRRARSGELTWVGRVILRLGLVNLPQFLNIVRGEMALFGPPPVRRELASRLRQLIPFYAHRFTMKPGLLGWAQTHRRLIQGIPEETLQLEYDLYYIKESSPSLDFEILLRRLLGVRHASAGNAS